MTLKYVYKVLDKWKKKNGMWKQGQLAADIVGMLSASQRSGCKFHALHNTLQDNSNLLL